MNNICLVCGYDNLDKAPYDKDGHGSDEICPCCGFQPNYDDDGYWYGYDSIVAIIHKIWRLNWIRSGYLWFPTEEKPANWDPIKQLQNLSEISGTNWRKSDD